MGKHHAVRRPLHHMSSLDLAQREDPVPAPMHMDHWHLSAFMFPAHNLPYRPPHIVVTQFRHHPVKQLHIIRRLQSEKGSPHTCASVPDPLLIRPVQRYIPHHPEKPWLLMMRLDAGNQEDPCYRSESGDLLGDDPPKALGYNLYRPPLRNLVSHPPTIAPKRLPLQRLQPMDKPQRSPLQPQTPEYPPIHTQARNTINRTATHKLICYTNPSRYHFTP